MYSQIVLLALLAQIVFTVYGENVMVGVLRPRSKSIEAHDKQVQSFWTPERLRAAKSLDVVLPPFASRTAGIQSNYTPGPASSVAGSMPVRNTLLSKMIANNGAQVRTTGRIFWQVGSGSYSCSGSVVVSSTQDLISTAGHCVYDTSSKQWFNNNNWVFIPAYSDGNAPYGTWPARNFLTTTGWTNSGDFNDDVAFVAVSTVNNQHIQSVVGAQGIGFNQPRLAYTYSFGYPGNLDSGRFLKSCAGNARSGQETASNFNGQGLPCNMGGGCSGGPWLQNVDESSGLGYITSVNSFTVSNAPNVMHGPYFDSDIQSLYDQGKAM